MGEKKNVLCLIPFFCFMFFLWNRVPLHISEVSYDLLEHRDFVKVRILKFSQFFYFFILCICSVVLFACRLTVEVFLDSVAVATLPMHKKSSTAINIRIFHLYDLNRNTVHSTYIQYMHNKYLLQGLTRSKMNISVQCETK